MSGVNMPIEEWLKGEHGRKGTALGQTTIDILLKAKEMGVLDETTIPELGDQVSASKKVLWRSVFEHMGKEDKADQIRDLDFAKFMDWLEMSVKEVKETPKEPKETLGMSATAVNDLLGQGADNLFDLAWLEVSLFMGRPVSVPETVDWVYGAPPNMTAGGRAARKSNLETFDMAVTRAVSESDLYPVDQWVTRLATQMLGCGHLFAGKASSVLMEWWMAARTTNVTEKKILAYVKAYRKHYMGRGFPVVFDAQIQAAITSRGEGSEPAGAASSSVSASAGRARGAEVQMAELSAAVQGLTAQFATTQAELAELRRARPGMDQRTCYNCNELGHHANQCPLPHRERR
jgi:hypothetical protein